MGTDDKAAEPKAAKKAGDPELLTMSRMARLMDGLDAKARARVALWLVSRYQVDAADDDRRECRSVGFGGRAT